MSQVVRGPPPATASAPAAAPLPAAALPPVSAVTPAVAPSPAAAVKEHDCPSCHRPLCWPEDHCDRCGIRLPSGRPIVSPQETTEGIKELATLAIRGISWVVPFGIYPVYSEVKVRKEPYAIYLIAVLTIFITVYAWSDESFLLYGMLWSGDPRLAPAEVQGLCEFHYTQFFTHLFLHADIWHLLGNMLFLIVLGTRVNALIGDAATAALYFLSGVLAALVQLISMQGEPLGGCLGASGAIMGLAGAYLVLFPVEQIHMAVWVRIWTTLGCLTFPARGFLVVLFFIMFDVVYILLGEQTGTAHWAHVGGMLAGVLAATTLLATRRAHCPANVISLVWGRRAWPLLGSPASHSESPAKALM